MARRKKYRTLQVVRVYDLNDGELEGIFEDGKMLDAWVCTEECLGWSHYTFDPFMEMLGFDVHESTDPKLVSQLRKAFR